MARKPGLVFCFFFLTSVTLFASVGHYESMCLFFKDTCWQYRGCKFVIICANSTHFMDVTWVSSSSLEPPQKGPGSTCTIFLSVPFPRFFLSFAFSPPILRPSFFLSLMLYFFFLKLLKSQHAFYMNFLPNLSPWLYLFPTPLMTLLRCSFTYHKINPL